MGNIRTELDTNTSLARMSTVLWVRITPQQFTHKTILWWFLESIDLSNIIKLDAVSAEETTMSDHNLLVEDVDKWEIAEDITEEVISG